MFELAAWDYLALICIAISSGLFVAVVLRIVEKLRGKKNNENE